MQYTLEQSPCIPCNLKYNFQNSRELFQMYQFQNVKSCVVLHITAFSFLNVSVYNEVNIVEKVEFKS